MHEYSLVRTLLNQVMSAVEHSPGVGVQCVRVCVGPLTGVEPVLVRQAFDTLKAEKGLPDCELEIDEQKLKAVCRQCNWTFEVVKFVFCCPVCQSGLIRVTQGDEFRLISIEVYDE